jgi:hypothetical protein
MIVTDADTFIDTVIVAADDFVVLVVVNCWR